MAEQRTANELNAEPPKTTNELLERAGAAELRWREEYRAAFEEAAPRAGGRVPTGAGTPAAQLSDSELIAEARNIHQQFRNLSLEYVAASESRRVELREEVQPLVDRARELRLELSGRNQAELTRERVADQQVGFSQ
jgi:hypothetical protein